MKRAIKCNYLYKGGVNMNNDLLVTCQYIIYACIALYVMDFIGDIIKIKKFRKILNDYITKLDELIERGKNE